MRGSAPDAGFDPLRAAIATAHCQFAAVGDAVLSAPGDPRAQGLLDPLHAAVQAPVAACGQRGASAGL